MIKVICTFYTFFVKWLANRLRTRSIFSIWETIVLIMNSDFVPLFEALIDLIVELRRWEAVAAIVLRDSRHVIWTWLNDLCEHVLILLNLLLLNQIHGLVL